VGAQNSKEAAHRDEVVCYEVIKRTSKIKANRDIARPIDKRAGRYQPKEVLDSQMLDYGMASSK
jgi:hypothetical protein